MVERGVAINNSTERIDISRCAARLVVLIDKSFPT